VDDAMQATVNTPRRFIARGQCTPICGERASAYARTTGMPYRIRLFSLDKRRVGSKKRLIATGNFLTNFVAFACRNTVSVSQTDVIDARCVPSRAHDTAHCRRCECADCGHAYKQREQCEGQES
jgi:hypothetical protein